MLNELIIGADSAEEAINQEPTDDALDLETIHVAALETELKIVTFARDQAAAVSRYALDEAVRAIEAWAEALIDDPAHREILVCKQMAALDRGIDQIGQRFDEMRVEAGLSG